MRILLIDVNCKYSSTGKIVYDLYKMLNRDGHVAAICYGRGPKVVEKNIYKFGLDLETYLHAGLTRLTGLTGCYSYFSTNRLISFIDKFKPDIVHIHELHAYFVNIATVINYLKYKNIPIVWTFHCEFMYTGKCGFAFECNKWQYGCGKCTCLNSYPKSLFFDFTRKMLKDKTELLANVNKLIIVTPSQWLADRVKKSELRNKDIRVIYNGIDTESIFYPRDIDSLKRHYLIYDEKVLLAVAPDIMSERKGGKYVLELAERFRMDKLKVVIVGLDENDLHKSYPNNVIPVGLIKDQNMLACFYSMADVFLICSKQENYPTVCLEAQSCGTPVCGFDVGGTKETSVLRDDACFVNYGDVQTLETVIRTLLNQQCSYMMLHERIVRNNSIETMYNNYKSVYYEIIK